MPTRSLMQAPSLPVKWEVECVGVQVLGAGAVVGDFFVMGGVRRSTGAVQQILETRSAVRIETSNAQCSQTNTSNQIQKHALLLFCSVRFPLLPMSSSLDEYWNAFVTWPTCSNGRPTQYLLLLPLHNDNQAKSPEAVIAILKRRRRHGGFVSDGTHRRLVAR